MPADDKSPALKVRGFSIRADLGAGAPQAAGERLVDPRLDEKPFALHALAEYFALAMDLGQQFSVRRREEDVAQWTTRANRSRQRAPQRLEAAIGDRRDEDRRRDERADAILEREQRLVFQEIDLVEHEDFRDVFHSELVEHLIDDDALLFPRRRAGIDHVEKEVGLACLLERGAERCDQVVRELANESHSVRDQHVRMVAEVDVARERVERGEQAILDENLLRTRQRAKYR